MNWTLPEVTFAPLLPWPLIVVPLALALALVVLAVARRSRAAAWRLLPLSVLALALAGPRLVAEERSPLDDIAVVLVDESRSQTIDGRPEQTAAAEETLRARLERLEGLEVRVQRVEPAPAGRDEGTRLYAAMERVLADVPRSRLAGVVAVTDGQAHDVPAKPRAPEAPLHVLLTGDPDEGDRRLVIEQAPGYGLVGESVEVQVRVSDPAPAGRARVTVHRASGAPAVYDLPLNETRRLRVPVEHGGQTVVGLEVEPGEQELTLANNRTALTINGVRDRLRVLLVSGEPHPGERTWRNLLKADPAVDLVHFTILRPPEKDDRTPIDELALISFPMQELFEQKLDDFDLVIFDRYRRRAMMPLMYFENIARYVEDGGALLLALGPEALDPYNLVLTPLEAVMPAFPDGEAVEAPFRPRLTDTGHRHPVTAGLPGSEQDPPAWGRWLRQIVAHPEGGEVVMEGPQGALLVLERVGEGRVAQLMSDTIWLWSRGWEGGGPQAELLRRLAHWLMKEPALEEERLSAEARDGALHIERRSLDAPPEEVTVVGPDGRRRTVPLHDEGHGLATAALPVEAGGLYRVEDGRLTAMAALGAVNPVEFSELAATEAVLAPLVQASGGGLRWLADGGVPDIRRVRPGQPAEGRGWLGLHANGDYVVTAVDDVPLLPNWLLLLLGLGGLVMAWWREGR